jgi:hypothetical protein
MTFIRRHSGDSTRPIVAVYTCPVHGEFDAEVQRDENGEAPDMVACTIEDDCWGCGGQPSAPGAAHCCEVCMGKSIASCQRGAPWTPSPVAARVRRVEAVKGTWEKPERETYLDTTELGEGMDIDDFREKRAAIWERRRQEEVMAVKKGML